MIKKLFLGFGMSLFLLGAGCVSFSKAAPTTMGVYRSSDKGENWRDLNAYPTAQGLKSLSGIKVYRIFQDPSDNNALYLGTRGQGLYYSYDKGETWQNVSAFAGRYIYGVSVDPGDKCNLYVTDGSAIYKSEDCSRTWKTIYTAQSGGKLVSMSIDNFNRSNIYAALENGSILQSSNAGISWRVIKTFKAVVREVMTDPQTQGRLYVATSLMGLQRSDDGGVNWEDASEGLKSFTQGLYFYRLVLDPGRKDSIYWLSKYGIFHSTDAGRTWVEMKLVTAPGSVNIYTFAVNPKNPKEMYYTGTVFGADNKVSNSKLYKSTDGGVSWFNRKLPSSAVPVSLFLHPDDPNMLFSGFTTLQ